MFNINTGDVGLDMASGHYKNIKTSTKFGRNADVDVGQVKAMLGLLQ